MEYVSKYGRLSLFLSETVYCVRFQVLTAVPSKFVVFCFLTKCRLLQPDDGDNRSSETSVIFYRLSSRNITEDTDLHHRYHKLKSGNNDCRHFHLLFDSFPRILDSVPLLRLYPLQQPPRPRNNWCPCSVALVAHETSCSIQALSCPSCKWRAGV